MAGDPKGFRDGALPTGHQLRSALRAGRLIDKNGTSIEVARSSYRLVPYGGLYRSDDLAAGEDVLVAAGLLERDNAVLIPSAGLSEIARASDKDGCEALLAALLNRRTPLWLLAATGEGILADELIPDDERKKLDDLLDPEARERLLLAIGRSFTDVETSATGSLAEQFILATCQAELEDAGASDLADLVRRVSEASDQLGYDITAPRLDRTTRRLEVKGTRGRGTNIVFYLSRNEAERGLADANWSLVVCRIKVDDAVELVGHVPGEALRTYLPADPRLETRWQSIRLELAEAIFRLGLPSI